ncbi:MAG: hypothetical protein FD126_196 [Elusimicrobia bacterium]|nr:MAG: hypothetical protein FD126_196 [Elusimicrobiota bacterium]
MGCNMGNARYPGYCAGTITLKEIDFAAIRRRQFVIPWSTAIEMNGKKPHVLTPMPQGAKAVVTYHKTEDGIDVADSVVIESDLSRRNMPDFGEEPWQMSAIGVRQWLTTGFLKAYTEGVQNALDLGEAGLVKSLLESPENSAHRLAVYGVADLKAPAFAPQMERLLDSPDGWVRAEAVYYAKALNREGVADKIADMLKDPYPLVRRNGARYLAAVKASRHREALKPLLEDADEDVKAAATKAYEALNH